MTVYYTESSKLDAFANKLKRTARVFHAVARAPAAPPLPDYAFAPFIHEQHLTFNPYRCIEPLKVFFVPPREKVASYFSQEPLPLDPGPVVVFGVKNCDIAGHRFQDYVFLEGPSVDAVYAARRQNTVLISGDCTEYKGVCHCLAWDIFPYPSQGFDLNLSALNDGFLVEVGSPKGEELIRAHQDLFFPAKPTQIAARKAKREAFTGRLKQHLFPQGLVPKSAAQRLVQEGYGLETWKEFMKTCVECGGCNFICDTCHCFLLSDDRADKGYVKERGWDSCQYANYARVAGGANPLRQRAQRLRFRFTKKFDFFVSNTGSPACCGCGRCIEVCPGKIDIREVLKDLQKRLAETAHLPQAGKP